MGILKEWLGEGFPFPFSSRKFGELVLKMSASTTEE
jgi:hypothetical protein